MNDEELIPSASPSQLQEAIDTIVQAFDHPEALSIDYTREDGSKRTKFEVTVDEGISNCELVFEAGDDNAEPELRELQ